MDSFELVNELVGERNDNTEISLSQKLSSLSTEDIYFLYEILSIENGTAPLYYAAKKGHICILNFLISLDITHMDNFLTVSYFIVLSYYASIAIFF